MTSPSDSTPVLVPGNIRDEIAGRPQELITLIIQNIYVQASTGEAREITIRHIRNHGWSEEAASWIYSQVKSKGSRIQLIFDRPVDETIGHPDDPQTAGDFRKMALTGFAMLVGIWILGYVGYVTTGSFRVPSILSLIATGMLLSGITRKVRKRY